MSNMSPKGTSSWTRPTRLVADGAIPVVRHTPAPASCWNTVCPVGSLVKDLPQLKFHVSRHGEAHIGARSGSAGGSVKSARSQTGSEQSMSMSLDRLSSWKLPQSSAQ